MEPDIARRIDKVYAVPALPNRRLDFGVALVADQDDFPCLIAAYLSASRIYRPANR